MANAIKLTICASYVIAGAFSHKNSDRIKRIALAAIVGIAASFALSSVPAILFNAVILTLAWRGLSSPPGGPAYGDVVPEAGVLHPLGARARRPRSSQHVRPGAAPHLDFANAARRGALCKGPPPPPPPPPRAVGAHASAAEIRRAPRRGRVIRSDHERSPSPPGGFERDPSPVTRRASTRGRSAASALHLPSAAAAAGIAPPRRRDPSPPAAGGIAPPRRRAPSQAAGGGIAPPPRREHSPAGAARDHSPASSE